MRAGVLVENELLNTIRAMPKIELHRHLEGSVRLETLLSIAVEHDITLPRFDPDGLRPFVQIMPGEPHDWQNFLSKFHVLRQFYRSPEIIKRVASEAVADAAADNIKYMELRFTPQALNNIIGCSYEEVVGWVAEAVQEMSAKHQIQVKLILSMNRHESVEIGERVLEAALAHCHSGVVGVDLAGQEAGFSAEPFCPLFAQAKEAGLGVTIHAGEWDGASNVRNAVESLSADRIGHGIRALEDPSVVALLVERGTVLEVCPTSNVQSGVIPSMEKHPLPHLFHQRVRTTINTDDPVVSGITLSDELTCAVANMKLSLDEVKQNILTSAQSAFLPQPEREALVAQFQSWLNGVKTGPST
jgi:adenosine deaminase